MPQFAQVTGDVKYTPGDGVPVPIPRGRIEVQLADDSATLSWEAAKGVAAVTAIPRTSFDEYVQGGKIRWEEGSSPEKASGEPQAQPPEPDA